MRIFKKSKQNVCVFALASFSGLQVMAGGPATVNDLKISWGVLENGYKGETNFRSEFTIINTGKVAIKEGWDVYFNYVRKIKEDKDNITTGNMSVIHVNGDFFKLSPKKGFNLNPGDSVKVQFTSADWAINYSDAPAGLYLVNKDALNKETPPQPFPAKNYTIKPFVSEKQFKRFAGDQLSIPTPADIYKQNAGLTVLKKEELLPVIPAPVSYTAGKSKIHLNSDFFIKADASLKEEKMFLSKSLSSLLESPLAAVAGSKIIDLKIGEVTFDGTNKVAGDEAYSLTIAKDKIEIVGSDKAGLFYGIQTLKSLFPVEVWGVKSKSLDIQEMTIVDFPRFKHRGMLLDVARNFQTKAEILRILDMLAFYKINKFHIHLTDDEGWRLEIPSLPELANIGGSRAHDALGKAMLPAYGSGPLAIKNSAGSGFYSKSEFIEILKYAAQRHIEVIPEIDVPGHSRAAIKAMDDRYNRLSKDKDKKIAATASQYLLRDLDDKSEYRSVQLWNDNVICVCQDGTYNFIERVVSDIELMYKEAAVPFTTLHIGGDEVPEGVWQKSPKCEEFMQKILLNDSHELYSYFIKRVNAILKKHNLNTGGWEEIALKKEKKGTETIHLANKDLVNSNMIPFVWNNVWGWGTEDVAYKLANAGYKVVLSNVTNLYFDLAVSKDPAEPGYYWGGFVDTKKPFEFIPFDFYKSASEDRMGKAIDQSIFASKEKLTAEGAANIIGIQGQLWSENVKSADIAEYMMFPKVIGLAQRAWSVDPSWAKAEGEERTNSFNKDWNLFVNTIGQKEMIRMDKYVTKGFKYALPTPGAIIEEGKLKVNSYFPGLEIRYTLDGTEPKADSPVYSKPVATKGKTVKLAVFSSSGRAGRTVEVK